MYIQRTVNSFSNMSPESKQSTFESDFKGSIKLPIMSELVQDIQCRNPNLTWKKTTYLPRDKNAEHIVSVRCCRLYSTIGVTKIAITANIDVDDELSDNELYNVRGELEDKTYEKIL